MLPQMDNYESKALNSIYGPDLLNGRCGSHFYVSCVLQKDQLRIVTYLCPRTLDQEAQAVQKRRDMAQISLLARVRDLQTKFLN
ncbi:hypothetical protein TWF718_005956 [Orbilia javanica]|uniref:Uncharacterized protein n=1 Tax=Orbilia javanica TaxID=47235 RepID=A0AAN8MZR5_9PEZI